MRAPLFLIPLMLSSAACSSADEMGTQTGVDNARPEAAATATATTTAAPAAAFTDNEERGGGSRDFAYAWPAAAAAQPALAKQLTADRDRILAREKAEWPEALEGCPADSGSCKNREFSKEWKVVAETPGFLSLSGDFSTYTGGAHGMYGRESLVWDKRAQTAVDGVELFRSAQALNDALGPKLCAALNAEREKRRGEPVNPNAKDDYGTGFDACQQVKDATVLVGSSTGRAFDRIGIWFGPYVAGPYAEGSYELNFPVDAAVLRAVKPEYAAAFAAR